MIGILVSFINSSIGILLAVRGPDELGTDGELLLREYKPLPGS